MATEDDDFFEEDEEFEENTEDTEDDEELPESVEQRVLPADEAAPAPKTGYTAMPNLAATMSLAYLRKVAERVWNDAQSDYKSSEKWRAQTAQHYRLYEGEANDSIPDQKNITLMHFPLVRRAVRMFHSKMFTQLYPPTGEMLMLKAGPGLEDAADRCSAHINHQCYNGMPEYIPAHDRAMIQNLCEGVTYEIFEYDPIEERAKQTIGLAEDVWVSYTNSSNRHDMADVACITWRKWYQQHELEATERAGYYVGITQPQTDGKDTIDALYPPETSYDEAGAPKDGVSEDHDTISDRPIKEGDDTSTGVEKQDPEPNGQRQILEQDRWLRLPGQIAQVPVTVCMDATTRTVVRIARREREDLVDRERHKREMMEWNAVSESQAAIFSQQTQEWEAGQQPQPMTDEMGITTLLPGPLQGQPPPQQPQPPPEPAPVKMVPWHRWTRYDCTMNPRGAHGHGVPHDVAGQNQLANKVATRAVSNMALSFLKTGIASRLSRFTRGDMTLRLGEINESPLSPSQVQAGAGMLWIDIPPPAADWYKPIEMADKSAQEVTAFDIAMGAPGMSGETATEAEMRHSNATDNISEVAQRYNRARAVSFRNLAYINSVTLPDDGAVVYKGGKEVRVFREDYEMILSSMEVIFTCDPNLESKAVKSKKAERLFNTVMNMISSGPVPAVDPAVGITLVRAASVMMLKAADAPPEWIDAIAKAPMPNMGIPPGGQPGQPGAGAGAGNGPGAAGEGPPSPDGDGGSPVSNNGTGPVS